MCITLKTKVVCYIENISYVMINTIISEAQVVLASQIAIKSMLPKWNLNWALFRKYFLIHLYNNSPCTYTIYIYTTLYLSNIIRIYCTIIVYQICICRIIYMLDIWDETFRELKSHQISNAPTFGSKKQFI